MKTTFGSITQPHIRTKLAKKPKVLASLLFYDTRQNPNKYFKLFSCVIYIVISKYVYINYIACEQQQNK